MGLLNTMILAQTTGSPEVLDIVLNLVVTTPLAGVILWLYLDERKERRSLQKQLIELLKVALPVLEKSTDTLDDVIVALNEQLRVDTERKIISTHERDIELRRLAAMEIVADRKGINTERDDHEK